MIIWLVVGLFLGYGLGLMTVNFKLDQVYTEGLDEGYKRGYMKRDKELSIVDLDDMK